ncbi:DnaJ domain-containing protein, partial [Campylobacter jejuni]|uniref:DnaJ domain-containing protein n=1 Tax=Campylobacter jejuni TaxID=197 RepID=UPI0028F19ABF
VQPPTLYDQLGVPDDADAAMLKAAFRKLMRTYHPDVYGPEGEAISKDLGAAYAVLSDPQTRERYDRELAGEDEAADAGPSWV